MSSKKTEEKNITIKRPNIQIMQVHLIGTAPLVTNRFANKADIIAKHQMGSEAAKKKTAKPPKDFNALFENAKHKHADGWCGVHAGSFRAALISACRLVGFKMTLAKLALFVIEDGFDADGTPLVRIHGDEPVMHLAHVRNETGVVDVRARPMWHNWEMHLKIRYDADLFNATDIANLLMRVGLQVGIGEGRPDSKDSVGMGWGTFTIAEANDNAEAAE